MAAQVDLVAFVGDALRQGVPRARIEQVLLEAGWPAARVREALESYAVVEFPIPVPRPKPYLSAFEAFLYLIVFSALYMSAIDVGQLAFRFIDRAFPDPAAASFGPEFFANSLRWRVSSLVIVFPLFLYLTFYLRRAVDARTVRPESVARKWLTYLTLFVAAVVLIGDMTSLVYNLTGGELTVRIALKVLTVAIIAGAMFGYYLRDVRTAERTKRQKATIQHRVLLGAVIAVVIAAVAASLIVIGSPEKQRELRFDDVRSRDLAQIVTGVRSYFSSHQALPPTLDALRGPGVRVPQDPRTGAPYEYAVLGPARYRLCADFQAKAQDVSPWRAAEWRHGKGYNCFEHEIAPKSPAAR